MEREFWAEKYRKRVEGDEVMAVGRDWARDAAEEIDGDPGSLTVDQVRAVIAKHCPFQPGVLYMPVPRCDQCRWWGVLEPGRRGTCDVPEPLMEPQEDLNVTPANFGCVQFEARE